MELISIGGQTYRRLQWHFVYSLTEIDFTWACVCSVTDHRILQICGKKNYVTHSTITSCAIYWIFLFLPQCHVICNQLLNIRTATWNLLVEFLTSIERVNVKLRQVNIRDAAQNTCSLNTCTIQVQFLMQRLHAAVLRIASGIRALF